MPALHVVGRAVLGSLAFIASCFFATVAQADQSVLCLVGQRVTISVAADGTSPFTYQWKKDDADIPGATNSTFVINNAQASDTAVYSVAVTNAAGGTISDNASVTVSAGAQTPVIISSQPTSRSAQTGTTTSFSVVTIGAPTPTYQWRKGADNLTNTGNISGATTDTLTLTNVAAGDAGAYSVVATNTGGIATSDNAVLTVVAPPSTDAAPTIVTQPVSQNTYVGQSITFSVAAVASPAPLYQWRKDGEDLAESSHVKGVFTSTLLIDNATLEDAGTYSVFVGNILGSLTSTDVQLTVGSFQPPVFTTQPANKTGQSGSAVTFTALVNSFPGAAFQWRKDGVNLTNGGNISGAKSSSLTVTVFDASDAGVYSVVATNVAGPTTSNNATLTIDGSAAFLNQPPALTTLSSGTTLSLTVTPVGAPAPTLQWRRNGANLANNSHVAGATSGTLTVNAVTTDDSGTYTVVATNASGSVTSSAFEVVVLAGNVSTQSVTSGHNVTLSGGQASGALQWQVLSGQSATWTNLSENGTYHGVTTNTLEIANATDSLNGSQYRLVSTANGATTVVRSMLVSVTSPLLPYPVGVAADFQGNLYVTDTSSDTVQKIDGNRRMSLFAGTAGSTGTSDGSGASARFNDPIGVALAPNGNLGIADSGNATFRVATSAGAVTTLAGSTSQRGNTDATGSAATFSSPTGVAVDNVGNFFIADSTNHTIRKVTPAGVVTTFAGSAGASGSADGTGSAARFNNPTRIVAGSDGTLYVSDTTNNVIRKISSAGVVTTFAGLNGVSGSSDGAGSAALFNRPTGLGIDGSNNLYVADTGNSTIRRISPGGVVTTYAGLPGVAGLKDGIGSNAWFHQPLDVTVAPGGIVYVADTGNAIIRQIAPDGTVTALALSRATDSPVITTPTLPNTPTLPDPVTTPPLPTGPTAPTPASSGGGGGGAPSLWFLAALGTLWIWKRRVGGKA